MIKLPAVGQFSQAVKESQFAEHFFLYLLFCAINKHGQEMLTERGRPKERELAGGCASLRRFRVAAGRLTYVHHKVMAITDDLEQLYEAEDFLVEGHWDDERRLNMVPGGKSGLRYLRENGLLSKGVAPLPDERDKILHKWLNDQPRLGLPAPWVAEKWKDNDWAIAQICRRDGRLSPVQVKTIRELAKNHTPEEIYVRIVAKDVGQVKRVLDGKTYARIA